METIWIKNPLAIYTGSNADAEGGIVIKGNKIIELVGKYKEPTFPIDYSVDASRHVVTPGLINAHHHFYQTLTRAYPGALNKELFHWLQSLYPVWANLDSEMMSLATELALVELMMSGCTTASDHHYLLPNGLEHAIDLQVEAAEKLGVRAIFTRGSMSLGEDEGGLPPRHTIQTEQTIIDDSQRLIRDYHQRNEGAMVQIALAPCSPFSVTTDLMKETAKISERENVMMHTHLCETLDEEDFCIEKFGLRPVDYLEDVGWLNERTWLAHGIQFNPKEIRRLGKAGIGISHCPTSNMMLASGICKNNDLEAAGVKVGLGVDGSASNDGSNMIAEVRMALYLQRLQYGSANVSHFDALRWATSGSAAAMGRTDIGTLEVGKQADIAMFKLDDIRFSGSHDPLAALLLCGAQQADKVMVAGKWRVNDGALIGVDMEQLMHRHHAAAMKLGKLAMNN
ncbi:8-oxoguanine deaminase [Vibrio sp. 10N.261.46.E12]|uniref:8-oxoguanine deaminase n=1 Tax=unclassified Vibrio TaxID=2614977 RepID=UPI000975D894|nr:MULTISPECIES: 8-oxoguanine deaminase [unclassified Vibrio]OMO38070.1 8-oxoguanine deaminase [Vibrio sp. 10N.261.45.E1]PMJ35142.1 8-oxoguanine deaminase [Vibrio sp. 10N.286.45.B6]PML92435.1 8-oxoguanine deaminase [Vibrio sp. 10N.261.49.E11]PMM71290.1 8-oxoguanine deaminase [Vibrio sp. 10N.261.46.F12]PMM88003.1 8-oxoguanine deaminase [Vibrio sp. 10N.261.46.E8]